MPPLVNPNKDWQQSVGTINSTTLAQTPSVAYSSPAPTPIYPVAALDPSSALTETAPEKQAQDLTSQLANLNNQLVGESAARTQAETAQGIPQLNQTITDLSSRLTGLKNEALAIPLQLQQDVQKNGAIVTAGGLQPHQTAALRNNAIQALSTNSLLEAARGNLTTAMDMADRAVKQRFDPIREEIAAKSKNLELIINSPAYSLADKKRAAQQLQLQNDRERALNHQEEDNKTAHAMAAAATKNFPNDAGAQMAIRQALALSPTDPQYLEKVFSLVGKYQTDPNAIQADLLDLQLKRAQIGQIGLQNQKTQAEINALKNPGSLLNAQGKPLNDTQAQSLGYARRIAESGAIVDQIGANFTGAQNYFNKYTPNIAKGPQLQQYEQAKRNFVNAVLRRESGAVISPSEFENADKQYFPQPGDSAAVVSQKKQNRDTVYQNLLIQAGSPNLTSTPSTQNGQTKVWEGKTYKVVNGQWVEQ